MRVRVGLFALLLAFWLVLSDQMTPLFLAMGVVSAALVAWLTGELFADVLSAPTQLSKLPLRLYRITVFVVWLMGRTLVSSMEVAKVVLSPTVPTDPYFVRFRTRLRSPLARTTLANAITLVPGTLTVRVRGDEFLVHALWPAAADDLASAELQRRIAALFLEPPEEPPELAWEAAGDET